MIEDGAYRRLLDHYYQVDGVMVANATRLLRVCRAFDEAEISAVRSVLSEFFVERDGYYYHDRADQELEKRRNLREKRALAGSLGGKRKVANATANAKNLLEVCNPTIQYNTYKEDTPLTPHADVAPSALGAHSAPPDPQKKSRKKKTTALEDGLGEDEAAAVAHYWNGMAEECGLSQVKRMTATRREKIKARVKEVGFMNLCSNVIDQIPKQPFLTGKNARGWKCDFDWILEPSNLVKIEERKFEQGGRANGHG